jgi:hypothetical protein
MNIYISNQSLVYGEEPENAFFADGCEYVRFRKKDKEKVLGIAKKILDNENECYFSSLANRLEDEFEDEKIFLQSDNYIRESWDDEKYEYIWDEGDWDIFNPIESVKKCLEYRWGPDYDILIWDIIVGSNWQEVAFEKYTTEECQATEPEKIRSGDIVCGQEIFNIYEA